MANFNFNKVIIGGRLTADPELKTTQHNFSNTIQLGDAFQVREKGWRIRKDVIKWAKSNG